MSIPSFQIIEDIWRRSGGPYSHAFLSTMRRGKVGERGRWHDYPFVPQEGVLFPIEDQPHQTDLFFSPLRFTVAKRMNQTVDRPGVLFADLDDAPTQYEIDPSVLWETSSGNRQAIWFLDRQIEDYTHWATLNRRMTRFTKADPGGWMGSKVLRVPGSVNWKRRDFGELIHYRPHIEYDPDWVERVLPTAVASQPSLTGDHPRIPTHKEASAIVVRRWPDMSLLGRSMLFKERVRDRSLHIVKTARELVRSGLSPEDIFVVLWWRPWNKWRLRDNPDLLWSEILNAME